MTARSCARAVGCGVLLVILGCDGSDANDVAPHLDRPTVAPSALHMAPGLWQPLVVRPASGTAPLSATFAISSADSCVARVDAAGVVSGVGPGATSVEIVATQDRTSWTITVPVSVSVPAALRLTIQSVTAGAPPVPVDLGAVRGTIAVVANADVSELGAVELRLAGRTVATQDIPVGGPITNGQASVGFVVNTAAKDAAGQPLYPNGAQTLEIRGTRRPYAAGCPAGGSTVRQPLTLANP